MNGAQNPCHGRFAGSANVRRHLDRIDRPVSAAQREISLPLGRRRRRGAARAGAAERTPGMNERDELLLRAARHAERLPRRARRPSGEGDGHRRRSAPALGGPLTAAGTPAVDVIDALAAAGRIGTVATQGPALLRLRRRRKFSGRDCRRLARVGVGSELRNLRALAARLRRRAGRPRPGSSTSPACRRPGAPDS